MSEENDWDGADIEISLGCLYLLVMMAFIVGSALAFLLLRG